ncbi:MAG: DUF4293 domain-containing protein, partial [Bacteroidales bacterium]|nr:DUF4293 domain-containing protein [Bacteroidales bacterium]
MIQRIQSLYLLVVVILMSLIVFLPYGYLLTANAEIIEFTALGAKVQTNSTTIVNYNAIPVLILAAISALTAFISIFLFKKRLLQIRLSGFNIVI